MGILKIVGGIITAGLIIILSTNGKKKDVIKSVNIENVKK